MNTSLVTIIMLAISIPMIAQLRLDVDGDARIAGKLNVSSTGIGNIFIGDGAGDSITTGNKNTFIGHMAGHANTTGNNNTFVGNGAGIALSAGFRNTFLGFEAGAATTFSIDNTFLGWRAGFFNTSGSGNSFIGEEAGAFNENGHDNTYIGKNTGGTNTSSTRNTFIGFDASQTTDSDSLDRSIALGYNARVNCSSCAAIGGVGGDAVKVGIGTDTPSRTLDVRGELFVKGTNGIAFFQSSGANSHIRFENNNGVSGTSVGYFDNGTDKYFFIDTPEPGFGEFVILENGFTGIGDPAPQVALDVIGSIFYTGNIADVSDIRLKENIILIENPIDKIAHIKGFTYNLIGEAERSAGVAAQDVQKVLPEAVLEIGDGYLGVDYTQLVPLLLEGIKQQQLEINTLRKEMGEIKALLQSQSSKGADEDSN